MLKDTDLEIPFNTVTPELRDALVAQGVKIGAPEKGNAGQKSKSAYEEWKKEESLENATNVSLKKAKYAERIKEWLSDENLAWAEGKERDEIIERFGNELEPIAIMPSGYLKYLNADNSDNNVYSGKGYFIDHAVNHHDEEPVEEYLKLQEILDHPDDVKLDESKNRPTLMFIKKYGKYYVEMVSVGDDGTGRVVLHKSFFHRKKMPHKGLPSVALEESSADEVSAISPSSIRNEAASSEFSALDDKDKGTENNSNDQIGSQENSSKPRFRVAINVATDMYDRHMSEKQSRNREVIALSILSL